MISGQDPLILADLLKVFTFSEIFPDGFSRGLIPPVQFPYHFGPGLCQMNQELASFDSIGIFMSRDNNEKGAADVTILSNMMVETEVNGIPLYVCNWKEWMKEHTECSPETIVAFAESAASDPDSAHSSKWKSLSEYAGNL
jgi:hypothetical protein